ncbi:MAG: hypothetical protein K2Q13_01525 [Nitrosomonas sp.]|uniref:hypothetical protein n=1 Tax=Nitrosomonas sp. TaxID=42353 RepID=UPI0025DDFC18|nr:hypothetical protein [Nitrosomonas sp.]MBY0473722.1 hypothetical protein [Nitrosomonas sp.]
MSNLRILYKNIFDSYSGISMASGSQAIGFGLANMKDDTKSKTFRSTNLTNPKIRATWASAQEISGVALAFTNLIAGSTFQITLYDDPAAGTLLHDTGAIPVTYNYDPPVGFDSIGSASFAYGGGAHVSAFFNSVSGVERMEIELTSAGNPDGYIEISRIIAGKFWEPNDNADYGAKTDFIDTTTGVRTSAGDLVTDRGTITRVMEFSTQAMDSQDKAALNNLFRSIGKSQPLFISLVPGNGPITEEQLSQQIYGKFDMDLSVSLPFFQRYSSSIRIIEL